MKTLLSLVYSAGMGALVCATDMPWLVDNQSDISLTKRLLRAVKSVNESEDERMLPGPSEAIEKVLTKQERKELFDRVQRDAIPTNTLFHRNMEQLMTAFTTSKQRKELSKLFTRRYGDGEMATALARAMDADNSVPREFLASLLTNQLERYLKNDLSLAQVFNLLNFPRDDTFFANHRILVLKKYAELRGEKLTGFLSSIFDGQPQLLAAIARAKKDPFHETDAREVENVLINEWGSERVHPLTLLVRFFPIFGDARLDALKNPIMGTIVAYVSYYNEAILVNKNHKVLLVSWLASSHGDDVVAEALINAMQVADSNDVATALYKELLEMWVQNKETIADVIKLLKLKNLGYRVLTSRRIEALEAYIKFAPESDTPDVFSALWKAFGDAEFAIALSEAAQSTSGSQRDIYLARLDQLFQRWYDNGILPSNVYDATFKQVDNENQEVAQNVQFVIGKYHTFYETAAKA